MAEEKKSLSRIAESSPGVATAIAQKALPKNEVNQISAMFELRNIHNELTSLPQNEAYKKFQNMDKTTRDALTTTFNPKYIKQDKGFLGGILSSVKSAVWYGGGTTVDLAKNISNLNPLGLVNNAGSAVVGGIKGLASELSQTEAGKKVTTPLIKGGELLVRPQNKLIKQPYMAASLAAADGENTLAALGRYTVEGFKELLPGGEDALPTDGSTTFKKYWEQAANPLNVYDEKAVAQFNKDLTPAASYLGRLLASKEDLVANFEQYQDNPAVIDLVNRYVSGDDAALKEVANAVAQFEKSKYSPGRDAARAVIGLLPHEYEKAVMGDGAAKALFTAISAPIDFTATFALDPLIIGGKIRRGLMVAKYGFFKLGEGSISIEKAFTLPKVQEYWNQAGKLVEQYRNGDLVTKAQSLNRLQDRFPEININVVEDLAKADVRNAEDALNYFDNGRRFTEILSGNAGVAGKDTLIPRMTLPRALGNEVKDLVTKTLGTERYSALKVGKTKEDFISQFSDSPLVWADKIGFEKTGIIYTAKDKSRLAKTDRVVRQFAIAPKNERIISIADGSSATQIYRLARGAGLDKTSAGAFRAVWLNADEGQRLLAYKGLLKTIGIGMGLNLSNEGRLALEKLDDVSRELYSPSQSAVDIGDLADVLRTAKGGAKVSAPKGVRKKVQEATNKANAEGKATRLIASVNSKIGEYTQRSKALKADKEDALAAGDLDRVNAIDDELKIVRARLGRELKTKKELKGKIKEIDQLDETVGSDEMFLDRFNAGQTADGTPRAIRQYQLNDYRTLPNFVEWREIAQRGGVLTELFGRVTNNHYSRNLADGWSMLNLYPRLGIRSSMEEVGMYGVIAGADGFGYYLKGRLASRAIRAATPEGIKKTVFGNERTDKNLGFIYDNVYKITKQHYTKEELLALADNPVALNKAIATAMLKSKFSPKVLNTSFGEDIAKYAGDFAEFDGKKVMDEINGAAVKAERPLREGEELSNSLKNFGPSVRFNVQNQEALKGLTFKGEFGEFSSMNDKAVFHWLFELNNTIGRPNGKFGNIVLWNAGKKPEEIINKLVQYIEGEGNDIAKKFAVYSEGGAEALAQQMYLDASYALRDFSGRINMDLVTAIRNKGGMDNFNIDDLVKLDKPYARPEVLMGKEIIPIVGKSPGDLVYRIANSGYGWMGKQIALLDREPITLANYFMFRRQLAKTEAATKESLIANGLSAEGADSIARFSSHETAMNLARNRTLSFVDNGDVRTNLAYSFRTLGRYYRATEDFYRRLGRLAKYEKRAVVRLAIVNQTFENTGFIHKDDRGQLYFTYPGDDLFAGAITKTLDMMGLTTYTPMPVKFGGYVKMLTPSLDPGYWNPSLSNPLASLSIDAMGNLPFIGEYIQNYEKGITGTLNPDAPAWEKAAPANVKRVFNLLAGNTENNESRFSSAVKAIKLLVSTGNGPTNASELQGFYQNVATQAKNVDAVKLVMGQFTVASIQALNTKGVPKELTNTGVFTWDSEFQKFMKKYDGDKDALSKALVSFAKLYPSKLAYTNFAKDTTTFASFRKTIEAENFVRKNDQFLIKHSDAGSFFIPATGTADLQSYSYLKSKGYISNQPLDPRVSQSKDNFIREVATTGARISYYALNDEFNAKIDASTSQNEKRYWREQLATRKKGLLIAYPLLGVQVSPTAESNNRRIEVINDMKSLLKENKAPNKELADTFSAMLSEYDKMKAILARVEGSSDKADEFKRNTKADTKDILNKISEGNANAITFFNSVLDPLIGD
jgi:hypothetical protein